MGFPEIVHEKGRHCASSGIRDLLHHHGLDWTEAMCFGIGAGLGIWYLDMPELGASRVMHVRSLDLEHQFFTRMGLPFAWEQFEDPSQGEQALCRVLDRGLPAIIQTDIHDLPYYNTRTHFPGHVIVAWGYDADRQVFFITDTEREGPLEVPFSAMRKARYCGRGPMTIKGNLFAPDRVPSPDDLPRMVEEAAAANSRALLESEYGLAGLAGLRKWRDEITDWAGLSDWKWTARFTYQVIEKRGTGGGGFRLMYADFLKEAGALVPEIRDRGLARKMEEAGMAWREMALALKRASERTAPDFDEAREKLECLIVLEGKYHREAVLIKTPWKGT